MTPYSPEARFLMKLLEDRQWHDYGEIKSKLAAAIGPGKALRKYQERLDRRRERLGNNPMASEPSREEKIRFGQRLVADTVFQTSKKGMLEYNDNAGGYGRRHVRLKPGIEIPSESASGPITDEDDAPAQKTAEPPGEPEPVRSTADGVAALMEHVTAVRETMAEGCPRCGDQVWPGREEKHAQWHRDIDAMDEPEEQIVAEVVAKAPPRPAEEMALFSEEQVRSLVAEELNKALDGFQRGMQLWMSEQIDHMQKSACVLNALPRAS